MRSFLNRDLTVILRQQAIFAVILYQWLFLSGFVSNTESTYVVCLHNPYYLNNNAKEVKKASFLSYVSCLFLVIFVGYHSRSQVFGEFFSPIKTIVSMKNPEATSTSDGGNNWSIQYELLKHLILPKNGSKHCTLLVLIDFCPV